jgi:hypothetical protein
VSALIEKEIFELSVDFRGVSEVEEEGGTETNDDGNTENEEDELDEEEDEEQEPRRPRNIYIDDHAQEARYVPYLRSKPMY